MSKIGDAVDAGTTKGIIFWINEDNTRALVMSENDLSQNVNWNDAMKICKEYDDNKWHLPSIDELNKIYESKLIQGGIYWSSTEISDYRDLAYSHDFSNGQNYRSYKVYICRYKVSIYIAVLAVMEIKL